MTIRSKEIPDNISERLLYRNQFILGPRFAEEFPSWKRKRLGDNLYLTIHPALNYEHIAKGNRSVTLIGYILDPCNPLHNDTDILHSLLAGSCNPNSFVKHTFRLGGRWILLVRDSDRIWMMHDATGLRQVCFTGYQYSDELWCASQPGLLSLLLNYTVDKKAEDYLKSDKVQNDNEFMWPAGRTAYKEISRLLPNHYLDLESGLAKRYWPTKALENLSMAEATKRISDTLCGLMVSLNNRYDLALGLTAGLDSRLILAASRDICKEVQFVSVKQKWMSDDYADLTVPAELLKKLGLSHTIVDGSAEPDTKFLQIFKNNVSFAHEHMYASDACAIHKYNNNRLVAVTGSVSEIAKCYLRLPTSERKCVTAERISKLEGMGTHSFAVNAFEQWLNGISNLYNVNLLDLLTWEVGSGSWLSTTQLEFDIAWKDIFTPYNCRQLLSDMLSVRESCRSSPDHKLYIKLIDSLWAELLSLPINPQNRINHHFKLLKDIRRYITRRVIRRFCNNLISVTRRIDMPIDAPNGFEFWESEAGRPKNSTLLSENVVRELNNLYKNDISKIQDACFLSKDEIKHYQWDRITKIVSDAYENVPFYKNLYQSVGFEPGDLTDWDIFHKLPIVRKEQLLEAGLESRINKRFKKGDLFFTRSSGSTGKVLRIAVDKNAILVDTLQGVNQFYRQSGERYQANHLLAHVYTVPWWFDNVAGDYQNAFISSLIEPDRIVSILNQLNPHIISCYPSHLAAILNVSNKLSKNLFLVVVHSEMSSKAQREGFSRQLGVPVLDEYSSEELTRIALEMPCGHYHVQEDAVLLEVLREEDWKPVGDGKCGITVGTNLLNVAMPLIRYCQGDHVKLPARQEPCKNNWLQVESVEGRTNDSFILDKGHVVPAGTLLDASYRWMFDSGIQPYAFEMVQKSKSEIEVGLCCAGGFNDGRLEALSSTIHNHIGALVGAQCQISVNITTQDFQRGKKYRPIRRAF